MKKILLALLLIFPLLVIAQKAPKKKKLRYKKRVELISNNDITQLKNGGVLLVRLKTKKASIDALRKAGNKKVADRLENEQKMANQEIIKAFKKSFKFCPTYFFYSDYSDAVRARKFDEVEFLGQDLQPDKAIRFNGGFFLTAEFGNVEQDTVGNYKAQKHLENENFRDATSTGKSNMGFSALVIRSDQFIQLTPPFPYYARTLAGLPFERTKEEVVRMMDEQLDKFLARVTLSAVGATSASEPSRPR